MKDIYHVRHFCLDCKREYNHSQGDWEIMKHHCKGHSIITCATKRLSEDPEKRFRQWWAIARNAIPTVI